MRSLNVDRKGRAGPRAKPARTAAARGLRELPKVQPGTARRDKQPGPVGRLKARLGIFARRPMFALSALVFLFVLVAALPASGVIGRGMRAVGRGVNAVTADAGFGISEIHITGNRRTPYNQVLAVLGMQPGESIFSADLVGARQRLAALDWIASAEVHRRYPDAIFVTLVEKRPFALWQTPADAQGNAPIAVVERSGAVITTREAEKFRHLPKLVGAGAPAAAADLVDAVQSRRAIAARIAAYARQSDRRWNLILDDGVVVKLPESGWSKQLDALEHLIIDQGILERDVAEIDLRAPTHYFFVLKSGEKKDSIPGKDT